MARMNHVTAFETRVPKRRRPVRIQPQAIIPYLMIPLLLAIWEGVAHSTLVTPFMLPSIEVVAQRIEADIFSGDGLLNLVATLYRTMVGFAVSATIGVILGFLMTRIRAVHWFFDPIISFGFPVPKVALLPVFILWFGLYDFSKIMLIIANAVFPVVMATVLGLRSVERHLMWSARSLGASERRAAWEIAIPAALPQILTGLQVALPISLIVAVVAEIVMSGNGLGGAMIDAARNLDSPSVFAGIIEIGLVGVCLIKIMDKIRRRLLVWHSETNTSILN